MKYQRTITILGEPRAQKRHRTVRMGSFNREYDPSKSDKGDFLSQIRTQAPGQPITGPVRVDTIFYFDRPKHHYGTGKNAGVIKDNAPYWHTSKPDIDNNFKFVSDAMSKIFWHDDSQICAGELQKLYSDRPRIEIHITEL